MSYSERCEDCGQRLHRAAPLAPGEHCSRCGGRLRQHPPGREGQDDRGRAADSQSDGSSPLTGPESSVGPVAGRTRQIRALGRDEGLEDGDPLLGALEEEQVARAGDHLEPRAGDELRGDLAVRGWDHPVLIAGDHKVPLSHFVPDLVKRVKTLAPEKVILIKTTVYDAAFRALREPGVPVVDERIPFPGSGQQKRVEWNR